MAIINGDQNPNKNDVLSGTTGDDTLNGLTGNDSLHGDAGNDTLIGGPGDDVLDGASGNDTLLGGDSFDDMDGGTGNDTLRGGGGVDQLRGAAGDDKLYGEDGNDIIVAFGGGRDELRGGAGKDILKIAINYQNIADSTVGERWDGGTGDDTVQLFLGALGSKKKTTVDLTRVTIKSVEHLSVGDTPFPNHDYTYTFKIKTAQFNAFDTIIMPSALGHIFQITDHGATVKLPKEMDFGPVLKLTSSLDKVDGRAMVKGSIFIDAGRGKDNVIGSNSKTGFLTADLGDGSDLFRGQNAREEHVNGEDGNDDLSGGGKVDYLDGGDDNDKLAGGSGDDFLTGGRGRDLLTGNSGADTFIYTSVKESPKGDKGRDIIQDFSHKAHDKIDLSLIDADPSTKAKDDKFDFIGASEFSGKHGEVRFEHGRLEADVNGDHKADLEITIKNVTHLVEKDFVL